ncbi:MAG: hypothetical protein JWR07_1113, partial [Nevskia sp.]|nr:hypothetical protein [Nevskia sp.]
MMWAQTLWGKRRGGSGLEGNLVAAAEGFGGDHRG